MPDAKTTAAAQRALLLKIPQIHRTRPQILLEHITLTDALSVLDAVVTRVELEVVAAGGGDAVVEQHAVGDEVTDAYALAAAVVDLHVLHDNAVDRGLVRDALLVGVVTGLAVAWEIEGGGASRKRGEGAHRKRRLKRLDVPPFCVLQCKVKRSRL